MARVHQPDWQRWAVRGQRTRNQGCVTSNRSLCPKSSLAISGARPRAKFPHKSTTMSPSGWEQQVNRLPSAGASTGSGRYATLPPTSPVSQVWQTPVRHDHRTGTSQASRLCSIDMNSLRSAVLNAQVSTTCSPCVLMNLDGLPHANASGCSLAGGDGEQRHRAKSLDWVASTGLQDCRRQESIACCAAVVRRLTSGGSSSPAG